MRAVAARLGIVFALVLVISLGWGALGATWDVLPWFVRAVFAVCLVLLCAGLAVVVETWSGDGPAQKTPPSP